MSKRPRGKPAWWKNSYFWIAGLLFVIAIIGVIRGEMAIRDPGQKRETGLVLIYLGGAVVMIVNGWISHNQSMRYWDEEGLLSAPREPQPTEPPVATRTDDGDEDA